MVRPRTGQDARPGGKKSSSYRLSEQTLERIDKLEAELNVNKSQVLELAVRLLAKQEGVE